MTENDDMTDEIPNEAREEYDEGNLDDATDEELLQEYYDTVHHLGVCDAEGQIDMTQKRWGDVLREKIRSRMDEDYTPTY